MRLTKIEIEAFRAYNVRAAFDCSADAVILVGPNGFGKTSFFDAIAWCLFGEIRRLRGSRDAVGQDYVTNRFSVNGSPQVTLHLSNETRTTLVRRSGGSLAVVDAGSEVRGQAAKTWIAELIRGGNLPRAATFQDAERTFSRCYLLGQEQMAAFLRETNPRERFDALSSLLGVDMVRSFYMHQGTVEERIQEDRSNVDSELLRLENRVETLRVERERIEGAAPKRQVGLERIRSNFGELRTEARDFLGMEVNEVEVSSAQEVLVQAQDIVARLRASATAVSKRIDEVRQLERGWPRLDSIASRLKEIEAERQSVVAGLATQSELVEADNVELEAVRSELKAVDAALANLKRDQDEFNSFLLLARNHMRGDRCPVCEQGIDPEEVVRRLEERVAELPTEVTRLNEQQQALKQKEVELSDRVREARAAEGELRNKVSGHQRETDDLIRERDVLLRRASLLSPTLDKAPDSKAFTSYREDQGTRLQRIQPMLDRAEQLVAEAQYLASQDRLTKLTTEQRELQEKVADLERQLELLSSAESATSGIIARAKVAERELVRELLDAQQPLLNALYQRLRPHPVLDQLRVKYDEFADRGEVYFYASSGDTQANVATTFSSAQLNGVAVCIFLSLNLSQWGSQLDLVSLDDPIQNLDDFNVLGLLDLLRGFVSSRQVIVATHDYELGELIRRKLRPLEPGGRTVIHRFGAFGSQGPTVETEIDEYRSEPYLLTAMAS